MDKRSKAGSRIGSVPPSLPYARGSSTFIHSLPREKESISLRLSRDRAKNTVYYLRRKQESSLSGRFLEMVGKRCRCEIEVGIKEHSSAFARGSLRYSKRKKGDHVDR